MNETKNKIQKSSKVIAIVLRIIRIVLTVIIGAEIAGLIWHLLMPDVTNFIMENGLSIIVYSPISNTTGLTTLELVIVLVTSIIQQGIMIAILVNARSIFKTIEASYSPFVRSIPKKMKIISVLIIFVPVFPSYLNNTMHHILDSNFKSVISSTGEIGVLVIAGICYCFAMVFDYGCMLQQENDETL